MLRWADPSLRSGRAGFHLIPLTRVLRAGRCPRGRTDDSMLKPTLLRRTMRTVRLRAVSDGAGPREPPASTVGVVGSPGPSRNAPTPCGLTKHRTPAGRDAANRP